LKDEAKHIYFNKRCLRNNISPNCVNIRHIRLMNVYMHIHTHTHTHARTQTHVYTRTTCIIIMTSFCILTSRSPNNLCSISRNVVLIVTCRRPMQQCGAHVILYSCIEYRNKVVSSLRHLSLLLSFMAVLSTAAVTGCLGRCRLSVR